MLNRTYLLFSAANQDASSAPVSFHLSPLVSLIIPVLLTILAVISFYYFWEKTHRPKQLKNKTPTPGYSNIIRRALRYLFSEDKSYLGSSKDKGVVQWRYFSYGAVIFSYLFFPMASIFGIPLWAAPIPLILTVIILTGRFRAIYATQENIISRIYQIAKTNFKYPNTQDIDPWSCIKVESWIDEATPKRVVISLPPTFNGTFSGSTEGFEGHFNSATSIDAAYRYEWNSAEGHVICEYAEPIPKMANYPGSAHSPWNEFPLGLGRDGEVVWNVKDDPHMLIAGPTGSGKSVAQRNVIVHCVQHSDMWEFIGIDVKRVELSPYEGYPGVKGIALDKEEGVEALKMVSSIMDKRYEQLMAAGLNSFTSLPVVPKAIMIMVDEAFEFMSPAAGKTEEAKQETALAEEATFLVGRIARLGRAAGIHMVIAMQRPDAKVLFGEIKNNFTARYAAGPMKATPSTMLMDSTIATAIQPGIKGRAVVSFNGGSYHLQTYYTSENWIDEWMASKEADNETNTEGASHKDSGSSMYRDFQHEQDDSNDADDEPATTHVEKKKGLKNIIKAALAEFKDPDGKEDTNSEPPRKKPVNKTPKESSTNPKPTESSLDENEIVDSYVGWEEEYNESKQKSGLDKEEAPEPAKAEKRPTVPAKEEEEEDETIEPLIYDNSSFFQEEDEDPHADNISIDENVSVPETNDAHDEGGSSSVGTNSHPPEPQPIPHQDFNYDYDAEDETTPALINPKEQKYDEWDDDLEKLFVNIEHNVPKKVAEAKYTPSENSKFSQAYEELSDIDESPPETEEDEMIIPEADFAYEDQPTYNTPVSKTDERAATNFDGVINELDSEELRDNTIEDEEEFDNLAHLTSLFEEEEEETSRKETAPTSSRTEKETNSATELSSNSQADSNARVPRVEPKKETQDAGIVPPRRPKSRHLSSKAAAVLQQAMKDNNLTDETWEEIDKMESEESKLEGDKDADTTKHSEDHTPQSLTNQIVRPQVKSKKIVRPEFSSKMKGMLDEESNTDQEKADIKRPIKRPGR